MLPCFTEDLRVLEQMVAARQDVESRCPIASFKALEDPLASPQVLSVAGDDPADDTADPPAGSDRGSQATGSAKAASTASPAADDTPERDVARHTRASLAKNKKWQEEQEVAFFAAQTESDAAGRVKVTAERKEEALQAMLSWSLKGAETNVKRTKDYLAGRAAASLHPQHIHQYNQLKKLVKPGEASDSLLHLPKHPHEEQPDFRTVGLQTVQRYHFNKDSKEAAGTPPTTTVHAKVTHDRHDEALQALHGWYQKGAEALAKRTKAEMEVRYPVTQLVSPGHKASHATVKKLNVPTGVEESTPMFAGFPLHPHKDVKDFQSAISGKDVYKQNMKKDVALVNPVPKKVVKVSESRHTQAVEAMHDWHKKGMKAVGRTTKEYIMDRAADLSGPDHVQKYERMKKLCDPTSEEEPKPPMVTAIPPHPFVDKPKYSPVVRQQTIYKKRLIDDASLVAPPPNLEKLSVKPSRHEAALEALRSWADKGSEAVGKKTREYLIKREMDAIHVRDDHLFSGQVQKYAVLRKLIVPGDPENTEPPKMLELPPPSQEKGTKDVFDAMVGGKTLRKKQAAADKELYMKDSPPDYTVERMVEAGTHPRVSRIPPQRSISPKVYERLCRHEGAERRQRPLISWERAVAPDPDATPVPSPRVSSDGGDEEDVAAREAVVAAAASEAVTSTPHDPAPLQARTVSTDTEPMRAVHGERRPSAAMVSPPPPAPIVDTPPGAGVVETPARGQATGDVQVMDVDSEAGTAAPPPELQAPAVETVPLAPAVASPAEEGGGDDGGGDAP